MMLIFLGTSAGIPTRTRNTSSILLDLQHPTRSEVWLFDCGEGTQHQLLKTNYNPNKLNKIFVTHLHGDHLFGLPGLLCSRSMMSNYNPVIIYGPKGIKEFINKALNISNSWANYSIEIIEIKTGLIFKDEHFSVTAKLLNHTVECYGYRIEELEKPRSLNAAALKSLGLTPGPLFKLLKKGETINFNNGCVVNGKDYLLPPVPRKKIVIFGDTAPCNDEQNLAWKVDLITHEATLEKIMEDKANIRGHSSSRQAAQLAKSAKVGKLIITHISSRYNYEGCIKLLNECRQVFPNSEIANDFSSFII